jgi:peptidoglycan/LPS O-acetylase OafA/YrhL
MTSIADRLDPRRNSLNFLRLVFALAVIVSHTWALGAYGPEPSFVRQKLGTWAVAGFFAISGYLIANSRRHLPMSTFLIRRVQRIYPGYVICIVTIALGFAPLSTALGPGAVDWHSDASFVVHNLFIKVFQPSIDHTLTAAPFGPAWDGSLWTLIYEVLCYLMIGVLLSFAMRWHRALVVAAFVGCAAVATVETHRGDSGSLWAFSFLASIFLAGSLIALYADRIPVDWRLFALAVVAAIVGGQFQVTPWLGSFGVAYACMWLGITLPLHRVGRVNDISYGVYIYAFPVQQLLLAYGKADRLPVALAVAASVLATVPFAVASWFLVEKPMLGRRRATVSAAPAPAVTPVVAVEAAGPP